MPRFALHYMNGECYAFLTCCACYELYACWVLYRLMFCSTMLVFLLLSYRKCHGHFSGEGSTGPSSNVTGGTNKLAISKLAVQGCNAKGSRSPQPQRPTHLLTPTCSFPRSSPVRSVSASPSCATSPQTSPGTSSSATKRFTPPHL